MIFALVILVDPYDSGRFGFIGIKGISDESPRTANASRGRDPQFNAAVFGNSTGQLLKPAELSRATGVRFVQLTVPGTGPREQIALLRWFVRHHARADALVIVTDPVWCTDDPALPILNPFPFWLYSDSTSNISGGCSARARLGRMVGASSSGLACARRARLMATGTMSCSVTADSDLHRRRTNRRTLRPLSRRNFPRSNSLPASSPRVEMFQSSW